MATIDRRGPLQWRARVRRGGRVETRTFENREEAERWAHQAEAEIKDGSRAARDEAERTTLDEALARYEKEIIPDKALSSQRTARNRLRRLQKQSFAAIALARIKGSDLAVYIKDRQDERIGASGNDVRLDLALISHLFTVARQDWGMPHLSNPVKAVRKPRLPPGRDRRLVGDEEARLLAAAATTCGGEIGPIITWAIETAMRRGKISEMRWEHVDQRARVLEIPTPSSRTPGRAKPTPRFLPLSTRAIAVLNSLPRQIDGRVWSMRADSISQAFERVVMAARTDYESECKQDGRELDKKLLKDFRFHDLRHEATSRLFEKGLNPMEVAAITGHKTLQMLKRYTHLRAEDLVGRLG